MKYGRKDLNLRHLNFFGAFKESTVERNVENRILEFNLESLIS